MKQMKQINIKSDVGVGVVTQIFSAPKKIFSLYRGNRGNRGNRVVRGDYDKLYVCHGRVNFDIHIIDNIRYDVTDCLYMHHLTVKS